MTFLASCGILLNGGLVPNRRENIVRKIYEADGWTVLNSGWPDFLCVRGKEIEEVEVKSSTNTLRPNQQQLQILLAKSGIKVATRRLGKIQLRHFFEDLPVMAAYKEWSCGVNIKEEFNGLGAS